MLNVPNVIFLQAPKQNFDFESHFFMSKTEFFSILFFTLEYKKEEQLLLLSYFDNFDFYVILFLK